MAAGNKEYEKIAEEMAQHYNKHYAQKFGPMGKMVSESNAVTEDSSRDLGTGFGAGAVFGQQGIGAARAQAAGSAEQAGLAQASPMSPEALRQAQMAAFNQPRPPSMGMQGMKGMKVGGKVSTSGRSYRGYGKARIPS